MDDTPLQGDSDKPDRRLNPGKYCPQYSPCYQGTSSEPERSAGDVYVGEKVASTLVVSCGDGAKGFEVVKESSDMVSQAIACSKGARFSILSRWMRSHDRLHATAANGLMITI